MGDNYFFRSTPNVNLVAIIAGVVSVVALIALGIALWRFLKRRRGAKLDEAPADSESLGVTTPAPQYITVHPKYRHLNSGTNDVPTSSPESPESPVEAGWMSTTRLPNVMSDGSRRTSVST